MEPLHFNSPEDIAAYKAKLDEEYNKRRKYKYGFRTIWGSIYFLWIWKNVIHKNGYTFRSDILRIPAPAWVNRFTHWIHPLSKV